MPPESIIVLLRMCVRHWPGEGVIKAASILNLLCSGQAHIVLLCVHELFNSASWRSPSIQQVLDVVYKLMGIPPLTQAIGPRAN